MTALAEYLIKANLCLIGFYALYYLLLRRHTFFRLNRMYLLLAMGLSFALPLIPLPEPVVETVSLSIITLPVTVTAAPVTGPTLDDVLLSVYGVGALLFLSLLLVSLGRLRQLIRSGTAARQADHTLIVLPDERVAPFSFFRYLVLNQTDYAQHADPIIHHELAHIRQWHSVDVLLAELVKVVCWPNPVAWLYKRSLQQVHEYLADQEAADKAQYARFLFNYAFDGSANPVANSFFTPALLTQRIRMLYQSRNTHRVLWKYALVVPLLALLVGLTAARERIAETLMSQPGQSGTVLGRVVDAKGKPLADVSIMDGHQVTKTDRWGVYKLTQVVSPARIMFGHVGFEPMLRDVTHAGALNVTLRRTHEELPVMGATEVYKAVGVNKAMPASADPVDAKSATGEVFTVVEQNPVFPDGIPGLMYYVAHNLRYPAPAQKAKVQGTVFVKFVVSASGAVSGVRVQKGIGAGCDEEAVRVVSQMPKWTPARQYGKPVPVEYVLPVQFALERQEDKRTGRREEPALLKNERYQSVGGNLDGDFLYVLDNKPLSDRFVLDRSDRRDFETIEVNSGKDAAKAYGVQGKDGVIHIRTKATNVQEPAVVEALFSVVKQLDPTETDFKVDGLPVSDAEVLKLSVDQIRKVEINKDRNGPYGYVSIYKK